jgi:glutathione synthase/RimK-type ligase-like ATP-grasp enzyme
VQNIIVVERPEDWPTNIENTEIVSAKHYLTDAKYKKLRRARIFNLCRSYRYQSVGYYVSLLAAARGHKPVPSVSTLQDMRSPTTTKQVSDDLDKLIQQSLVDIRSEEFDLSIYFGRNIARKYDRLSRQLYQMFHAPLVRAKFVRTNKWNLKKIGPISATDVPDSHWGDISAFADEYFQSSSVRSKKPKETRFLIAILVNDDEEHPPSDAKALQKFMRACEKLNCESELIRKSDYLRLPEFDGLFIRETTSVNHHTFRFAHKAQAEGLVVIDDPESILKCTNKVFLSELLENHDILSPRTLILHKKSSTDPSEKFGFPLVLKRPDSSFSQGVKKVSDHEDLRNALEEMFESSELVIAQEFIPTDFDWRVGVIDGKPLYVCKYYMARAHWQIIKHSDSGKSIDGRVETLPVELAPAKLIKIAMAAANLIGRGLYGVDVKQIGDKFYVIEINDNPSIDCQYEDTVLKDALYERIIGVFVERMTRKAQGYV